MLLLNANARWGSGTGCRRGGGATWISWSLGLASARLPLFSGLRFAILGQSCEASPADR